MARASMAELIDRTRTLIFDPSSPTNTFSDDQIQDALDFYREEQRWVALRPMPTYVAGGNTIYLDYYTGIGNWESDVQLQDLTYATITPSLSELIVGHWAFASQPNGIGVRATGKTYDIYASAADLLEWWVGQVKMTAFSVRDGKDAASYKDIVGNMLSLAGQYRARALPHIRRMYQGDAAPDNDGGGVVYPSVGNAYQ